jgi:hypothetical protein
MGECREYIVRWWPLPPPLSLPLMLSIIILFMTVGTRNVRACMTENVEPREHYCGEACTACVPVSRVMGSVPTAGLGTIDTWWLRGRREVTWASTAVTTNRRSSEDCHSVILMASPPVNTHTGEGVMSTSNCAHVKLME